MTPPAHRVALVTGAGRPDGIGFAAARLLAAEGCAVVLAATSDTAHERAGEMVAAGFRAVGAVGDLRDEEQAAGVVATAVDRFGRLDVVVNNAGMTSFAGGTDVDVPVVELSRTAWDDALARNLTTAFLVTRVAIPALRSAGGGRVVMVASTTGPVSAMPGQAGYGSAKAGLVGLTRTLALELAGDGVTVNAVLPGWIDTGSATDAERAAGRSSPIGRSGTPEEVAAAIAFLASPQASYVTGACLVVDGGNGVLEDRRLGPD